MTNLLSVYKLCNFAIFSQLFEVSRECCLIYLPSVYYKVKIYKTVIK